VSEWFDRVEDRLNEIAAARDSSAADVRRIADSIEVGVEVFVSFLIAFQSWFESNDPDADPPHRLRLVMEKVDDD
jgi:hypothetical protein